MRLTANSIKSKKPGDHADGANNLYLRVRLSKHTGKISRSWLFRYQHEGKRSNISIGNAEFITLKQARDKAFEMKRRLENGVHPSVEGDYIPFRKCFDEFIENKAKQWTNSKSEAQWRSSINAYAPNLVDKDIKSITTPDVVNILKPIWATKSETAGRVRQRIEATIDYAIAMEYMTGKNPAVWKNNLEHIMPSLDKVRVKKHHKSMPYEKVPKLVQTLVDVDAAGARALLFTILTAARTNEVIGATHGEIENDIWVIPATRMKANREHRVPLSEQAASLVGLPLALKRRIAPSQDFLFSNIETKCLSNMAMYKILKNRCHANKYTVHGFRASFRTWCADNRVDFYVAETCLAHSVQTSVQDAYQRSDLLEQRAEVMQAWADFVLPD